ncbi:hypothetical protein B0T11DRAFT_281238 [Plectosphaerella cucumerina]|uniref:Uncharacterized protein n=1 Tax=Plectosphaerella cucumerina TaxID=40658 RepID=A0A8K0TJK4_9PEZI|nr:hypothetical protein B0T11DRAFT_281238 [Plectosphaerella cucumerina]
MGQRTSSWRTNNCTSPASFRGEPGIAATVGNNPPAESRVESQMPSPDHVRLRTRMANLNLRRRMRRQHTASRPMARRGQPATSQRGALPHNVGRCENYNETYLAAEDPDLRCIPWCLTCVRPQGMTRPSSKLDFFLRTASDGYGSSLPSRADAGVAVGLWALSRVPPSHELPHNTACLAAFSPRYRSDARGWGPVNPPRQLLASPSIKVFCGCIACASRGQGRIFTANRTLRRCCHWPFWKACSCRAIAPGGTTGKQGEG